jgi:putative tricarboxylic transport membrane protein
MNRQDQIGSLVWFFGGLFIVLGSLTSLKIGTANDPGPGLFPFLAGIVVTGFSLAIFLKATFQKNSGKKNVRDLWATLQWRKVVYTIAILVIYSLLLESAGFLLTTLLLFIFLFRKIEPQRWRFVIAVSVFTSTGAYLIFDRVLQVQLPKGLLGF